MARTDTLGNFLTDVANAIRTKKGTSEAIQASDFDTEIENLPSGGNKYAPRFVSFYSYSGTELEYELDNLDVSNISNYPYTFYNCSNLKSFNPIGWVPKEKIELYGTFRSCGSITSINMDCFANSNFTTLTECFQGCSKLEEITVKGNLSNDFNPYGMMNVFYNCKNLKKIDLSTLDNTNVPIIRFSSTFYNCTSLELVDMRNFTFSSNKVPEYTNWFYNVPQSCTIIVKDATQKNFVRGNMGLSGYNVKTVAEYEAE